MRKEVRYLLFITIKFVIIVFSAGCTDNTLPLGAHTSMIITKRTSSGTVSTKKTPRSTLTTRKIHWNGH